MGIKISYFSCVPEEGALVSRNVFLNSLSVLQGPLCPVGPGPGGPGGPMGPYNPNPYNAGPPAGPPQ